MEDKSQNLKKRRGLCIDSEEEESEEVQQIKVEEKRDHKKESSKKKKRKHESEEEDDSEEYDENVKEEEDSEDDDGDEDIKRNKKIQEKQRQKEQDRHKQQHIQNSSPLKQKLSKSDRKDLLESLSNYKTPSKRSIDEISELFVPDQSDDFSDINRIKEELAEEKRLQEIREEKKKQRREREKQLQEDRERERKDREKREKEKRQQRKQERDYGKSSPVKKSTTEASRNGERVLNKHEELVYEVLVRWWYCMPDWPPADYNYDEKLTEKKLKVYDTKQFRKAPNQDAHGLKKVVEFEGFTGCFKDGDGNFIDLRPEEGKPSFNNLKKKSDQQLRDLLCKALTEQMKQLEEYLKDSENEDQTQMKELKRLLQRYSRN